MFYIYVDGEPLLYPSDNGLTLLSPKLTLGMGKAGSLTFKLPPTNRAYAKLRKMTSVITVERGDKEIFRGRATSDPKDFYNTKTVYCEGDLAYLVDSEQQNEAYEGTTHGLFDKILDAHNARMSLAKQFRRGEVTVEDRPVIISGKAQEIEDAETSDFDYKQVAINAIANEWVGTLDYIEDCLIDYCGGYLRTRHVGNDTYLDYVEEYGGAASQEIEFGVNLLDLVDESAIDDLVTVLIPLGDDNLTIESVNNGSDELVSDETVKVYDRIVRSHVFDNVNKPETLLENGKRYLEKHSKVPVTVVIKAVDLSLINPDIEEIAIGDKVHVKSAPHGIADELTCVKIEYDLENAANTQYTFGVPRQTLTERYRKDKTKATKNAERAAVSAAAKATKEGSDHVYKEWVDWDPNDPDGHVSIGAMYQRLKNATSVLENQVGIDLDAVSGNINIKTLGTRVDEATGNIAQQGATIDLIQDEVKAQAAIQVDFEGALNSTSAEIKAVATEVESLITIKADKVALDAKVVAINAEITNVKKLIADKIKALEVVAESVETMKLDATWMKGFTIDAVGIDASYGNFTTIYTGGIWKSGTGDVKAIPYALSTDVYLRTDVTEQEINVLTSLTPASTTKMTFLVAK